MPYSRFFSVGLNLRLELTQKWLIITFQHVQLINEDIMRDVQHADPEWKIILLRYFNPVGCHPSGEIGEDPLGFPNNLMPFVQQVAVGRKETLSVCGHDYDTRDGTGVICLHLKCSHLILY